MDIIRTYEQIDGRMVHDGYFLLTPEYPLKWISRKAFSRLSDANHPALVKVHGLPTRMTFNVYPTKDTYELRPENDGSWSLIRNGSWIAGGSLENCLATLQKYTTPNY